MGSKAFTNRRRNNIDCHHKMMGARYFPNPSGAPLLGPARRRHAQKSRETAAAP